MNTAIDLLERAKCGTVIVELASAAAARELFLDLCEMDEKAGHINSIHFNENKRQIIINPS